MKDSSAKAVAIDCGASSVRYALGELHDGAIRFEIVRQAEHHSKRWDGRDVWDIDFLLDFCRDACRFAAENGAASVGIDTWGVDHGFVDADGCLIQPPVCYRDHSHTAVFEELEPDREWLYTETGIQHQPFNTLYQLIARKRENPALYEPGVRWLLLPDLLICLLGGEPGYEQTMTSTTQLLNASGGWNRAVFERYGLPVPSIEPTGSEIAGTTGEGVRLVRVASHDTASAVFGLGLEEADIFANIGTWALVGQVGEFRNDEWARQHNLTNERTIDGRVRLLANVPGFYVINRLRDELAPEESTAKWLEGADLSVSERFDILHEDLYAPESMAGAVLKLLCGPLLDKARLAGIAIHSLADAIAATVRLFEGRRIRIAGGGSQSDVLCRLLSEKCGRPVVAGPVEATVLGNLAAQFRCLKPDLETDATLRKSFEVKEYCPDGVR